MRCIDADALNVKFEDMKKDAKLLDTLFLCGAQAIVDNAPTIEPTQGEWTDGPDEDYMICSNCDEPWNVYDNDTHRFKFCPNCGADMRVGDTE